MLNVAQVNHSVEEEYLGAVNGLGQSMAALARAIGPALGGALWSISIKTENVFINFTAVVCLLCVCGTINRRLPASIDKKPEHKEKEGSGKDTVNDSGSEGEEEDTNPMPMMH